MCVCVYVCRDDGGPSAHNLCQGVLVCGFNRQLFVPTKATKYTQLSDKKKTHHIVIAAGLRVVGICRRIHFAGLAECSSFFGDFFHVRVCYNQIQRAHFARLDMGRDDWPGFCHFAWLL